MLFRAESLVDAIKNVASGTECTEVPPLTTLIRLYELLKNNSRLLRVTGASILVWNARGSD
jgi:hypothetical protein